MIMHSDTSSPGGRPTSIRGDAPSGVVERDLVVAVDCSTSGVKAVVFDSGGNAVSTAKRQISMARPAVGWHEQNAEDWWISMVEVVRESLGRVDIRRIAAICVANQRETFVCLDESGQQVRPAIVWMDNRAESQIARFGSDEVHAMSGRPADTTPSLYKLIWLREQEPQTLERARFVGDVGAYLHLKMIDKWVSSLAGADSMGLMDMKNRRWSESLCEMAGVSVEQLPKLVHPGSVIGKLSASVATELGLMEGTPVIAGAGDGQCAALGACGDKADSMYLNMGTAIVSGTTSPNYQWSRSYRTVMNAGDSGYVLETVLQAGTYLINWFRENFGPSVDAGLGLTQEDIMETAASKIAVGAEGLIALPYWNSAQTPYWDSQARGAVLGWTGTHGRAHLYRALLEGIAFEIRLTTDGVESEIQTALPELTITGGGARSKLWSQILADVTGRRLLVCRETETTALGAAILGMVGAGIYADAATAAAAMTSVSSVIHPDPIARARYNDLYSIYKNIYPTLKPLMDRMASVNND